MIKLLWVCNVPLPEIAERIGRKVPTACGWLSGYAGQLREQVELSVLFPFPAGILPAGLPEGETGGIHYYAFPQPKAWGFLPAEDPLRATKAMKETISQVIRKVGPDILHIFGTEYVHSLVAAEAFGRPERTFVSIQGLTSQYWKYSLEGIPMAAQKAFTPSSLVRGTMRREAERLRKRGEAEKKVISLAGHVVGRTAWDFASVLGIHPDVHYHRINESLREIFYEPGKRWDFYHCERQSIFMSQGSVPQKGLHIMIEAMPKILRFCPGAKLYVAGNDVAFSQSSHLRRLIRISPYGSYIRKLIFENHLEEQLVFLGPLSAEKMRDWYLRCNVFVLPSSIENSPNSLGEAMSLGVPSVSSAVGGVPGMVQDRENGYLVHPGSSDMLALSVISLLQDPDLCESMGDHAARSALAIWDREKNAQKLLQAYQLAKYHTDRCREDWG